MTEIRSENAGLFHAPLLSRFCADVRFIRVEGAPKPSRSARKVSSENTYQEQQEVTYANNQPACSQGAAETD
jgi:hypothetical protein